MQGARGARLGLSLCIKVEQNRRWPLVAVMALAWNCGGAAGTQLRGACARGYWQVEKKDEKYPLEVLFLHLPFIKRTLQRDLWRDLLHNRDLWHDDLF